jgi:MYXO-CTERM domain-containing protein
LKRTTRAVTSLVVALGTLASLVLASSSAYAYCRMTTKMPVAGATCVEDGIPLAWRRQCMSFSLVARKEAQPPLDDVRDTADASFHTWEAVSCNGQPIGIELRQTVPLATCEDPEYNQHYGNANTVIFVDDWAGADLPEDAFGITQVWHNPNTGEILDADMRLNETLGTFGICGATCPPGVVDIQNVMTHEAGHFLGLGHSSVPDATMSARAAIGETSKRTLAEDDIEGVCAIYGSDPAANCTPTDFTPNHGFAPGCAPPDSGSTSGVHCNASDLGSDKRALAPLFALLLACGVFLRRRRRESRA